MTQLGRETEAIAPVVTDKKDTLFFLYKQVFYKQVGLRCQ